MTIEELRRRLEEAAGEGPEDGHIEADNLLLEYIGDAEVTRIFKALRKWYS